MSNVSATSLNFLGFENMKGYGTPELLFNRIFIEPNLPETAGKGAIAVTGFLPGQQSYLKARRSVWSKSTVAQQLERQGFLPVSY